MKRARYQTGSVVFDKRRGTWAFLWREGGKRRSRLIGTKAQYPTKAAARKAAEMIKLAVAAVGKEQAVPLVSVLVERFRAERMPDRQSTRRGYNSYLNNYILPVWGALPITALQPRQVELWLKGLHLAPKSKAHIRGLLSSLVEYSMWSGAIPVSTNPITLVKLLGTSRPAQKRRSLTPEQFHTFTKSLSEPFRTMALLCASLGLRISECLALKWEDVDWLNARLAVRRGLSGKSWPALRLWNPKRICL
jgi:integrase